MIERVYEFPVIREEREREREREGGREGGREREERVVGSGVSPLDFSGRLRNMKKRDIDNLQCNIRGANCIHVFPELLV